MGNSNSSSLQQETPKRYKTTEKVSVCRTETTTGSHRFEIHNYSLTKGGGHDKYILSKIFSVGGHDWAVRVYLDGARKEDSEYLSVYLQFESKSGEAKTDFSISLLELTTGKTVLKKKSATTTTFNSTKSVSGFSQFLKRDIFEASNCLKEDFFTIICQVTVIKEPHTYITKFPAASAPINTYYEIGHDLLLSETGADITCEAEGECFPAHKCILALRSPVFNAQLFGAMKDEKQDKIKISNVRAPIFKAMLFFIYTGLLPDHVEGAEAAQHLLVAADRYGMQTLRRACEERLSQQLDVVNVGTTLALAEQHNLTRLKSDCLHYLSFSEVFFSALGTEGFAHLAKACPDILKEISNMHDRKKPKPLLKE
ncbi:BTB/POZ/MATH-domain protein [Rhynchospora pubera]|uniref:BTB/POZ/MATH-domain protein n=1 Tax=Rhynchospora pubera TaxID=906938 RepID=A0AAV8HDF6_9POAL|nr:BTB/POZ/MATH-domain protein [Rhynchospora pubera]